MKKRIICKGGLGNQMFQYAFYLMMRHYRECKFDISLFDMVGMHNGFELCDAFQLQNKDIEFSKTNPLLLRTLLRWGKYPVYIDKLKYNPDICNDDCVWYDGYWQSEKWFVKIKEEVIESFKFRNVSERNKDIAIQMEAKNSVSIHIRRGDYLGNPVYDNCVGVDYYIKAIELIKSKVPDVRFWVFSNDISWCQNNISVVTGSNVEYVDWNKGKDSYQDMYLMSKCRHNIIANSSFSWWGAYLNLNRDKIVLAPCKWINRPADTFQDIVPESWLKI